MKIYSRNCHQCGVFIAEQNSNISTKQDGFEIIQIAVKCKNGHKQPSTFEDDIQNKKQFLKCLRTQTQHTLILPYQIK